MKDIIQIEHLKKYFGNIKAVDDISFKVKEGSLFAFLGLNGAGKSTTINIICGIYEKDFGEIIIDGEKLGENQYELKRKIGVVYQNSVLDKQLTVKDNLQCRASLYGINGKDFTNQLEKLDKLFDLKALLNRPIEKLSGGQRRRIDIARAVIHNPKILILDEPTTGLDPQTRKMVWTAIDKLRSENKMTIFLTTHYMEESADADNVIIIDSGKIVAEGSPLKLKNKFTGDFITVYNTTEEQIKKLNMPYTILPEAFRIAVKDTLSATQLIIKHPEIFVDYEVTKGKMDDVFLSATGKKLSGGEANV